MAATEGTDNSETIQPGGLAQMKPCNPRSTFEFFEWCRQYHSNTPVPLPVDKRFAVGVYQLSQGIAWEDVGFFELAEQSYAAGAIHFVLTAIDCKICVELWADEPFDFKGRPINWKAAMQNLGTAQQMLVYANESAPRWKARYKPAVLEKNLEFLVWRLLAGVSAGYRGQAVFDETSLIIGTVEKEKEKEKEVAKSGMIMVSKKQTWGQCNPQKYWHPTKAEWEAEGERLFGSDRMKWAFVCPACKGEMSIDRARSLYPELKGSGWAPHQECVGRYTDKVKCDWCAYGLFKGPVLVQDVTEKGKAIDVGVFDFVGRIDPLGPKTPTQR